MIVPTCQWFGGLAASWLTQRGCCGQTSDSFVESVEYALEEALQVKGESAMFWEAEPVEQEQPPHAPAPLHQMTEAHHCPCLLTCVVLEAHNSTSILNVDCRVFDPVSLAT